jgi:hypothetical protein
VRENRILPVFWGAAVIEGSLVRCETYCLTKDEIGTLDSVWYQLLLRTMYSQSDIRSGKLDRKSMVDLVEEQAAKAGCVTLPVTVHLQAARLRYLGHIARRELRLRKDGKPPCPHTFLLQSGLSVGPRAGSGRRATSQDHLRVVVEQGHGEGAHGPDDEGKVNVASASSVRQ